MGSITREYYVAEQLRKAVSSWIEPFNIKGNSKVANCESVLKRSMNKKKSLHTLGAVQIDYCLCYVTVPQNYRLTA